MGIDQSLTSTGIVVWQGKLVFWHNVLSPSTEILEDRLWAHERAVIRAFKLYRPKLVAIEGPAPGARAGNDSRPHMVSGVVRLALHKREALTVVIAPGTLKKEATGNGRASKPEMLAAAQKLFPECPNHDVADAFFLAKLAYDCYEDLVEEEVS